MAKQAMTSSGLPANVQHSFARVPNISKPRSSFDRSFPLKTSISAGIWTPLVVDEVLPGDSINWDGSIFARLLSPLAVPIYDNMYLDWIAIFCPNRLVWTHFVNQMGEQHSPADSIDYLTPQLTLPAAGFTSLSLMDYMGLPLGASTDSGAAVPTVVSALPFRMYNLFIQQWVLAQNVVNGVTIHNDDGPDPYTDYVLINRMKRPDYFTSCQPATQKGSPVEIPIAGSIPVKASTAQAISFADQSGDHSVLQWSQADWLSSTQPGFTHDPNSAQGASFMYDGAFNFQAGDHVGFQPGQVADLYADGSAVAGITINEFRLLATTQQFLELDERSGTRYPEYLMSHWGVQSSDARLQRVEFIGAGTIPIMTHVVPQTTPVISGSTPQANLAAYTSASGRCSFNHSFEEHGHIMILVEVRADITYQQGLKKMWSRQTRYDYYDPLFANIGEQPVLNREIYNQGTSADTDVFGYQEYAAEYRFGQGMVTGLMRDSVTNSISVYNLALHFSSLPALNSTFLNDSPPITRVSAVSSEPYFILDSFHRTKWTRVMPTFSIPGLTRI